MKKKKFYYIFSFSFFFFFSNFNFFSNCIICIHFGHFFKKIINKKNKLYYIFLRIRKKTKQLLVKKILFIPDIA